MRQSTIRSAKVFVVALPVLLSFGLAAAGAAEIGLVVQPTAGGSDVPVSASIKLPTELASLPAEQIRAELRPKGGGRAVPGQVVLAADGSAQLWWVLPAVQAGQKQQWTAALSKGMPAGKDVYGWKDTPGKHLDLLFAGRPVTRYMYEYDPSGKRRFTTAKCFHHVFNEDGTDTITNGAGGQYPHHRGIFIGFSRLAYDGGKKRSDWWHVRSVAQVHQKLLAKAAGPVVGSSTTLIHWNDPAVKPVVIEERQTVVFRQPQPTIVLLDFRSRLKPARGDIRLDGDPEHAGMQFRPHNDVDRKVTKYLFHKEEITSGNVKRQKDLPWAAETFVLRGKTYSAQHMNHPKNPKGTVYSAYRDYGRFGAFFKKDVKEGETLEVCYRIWAATGKMPPREQLQARWEAFANPPKVELTR